MLKVLDLFSGIGGLSLGLERTGGFETVAFCEIEEYPRNVLGKHWPDVPIYEDIRELTGERVLQDVGPVDVICGGFPCQDISIAGKGKGLAGSRSGLWFEYARIIRELRPQIIIVENSPELLNRGMGDVLKAMAEGRYNAEWDCLPAVLVDAEHMRERIWIIAYLDGMRKLQSQGCIKDKRGRTSNCSQENDANTDRARRARWMQAGEDNIHVGEIFERVRSAIMDAPRVPRDYWNHKPVLGGRLHGVPNRLVRIKALGNAVLPQIPEMIGSAVLATIRGAP